VLAEKREEFRMAKGIGIIARKANGHKFTSTQRIYRLLEKNNLNRHFML
jgi:hypothetical protein